MRSFLTALTLLLFSAPALANFSYEGYLVDAANNPVVAASVAIKLQIKTITNNCLLYEETHNVNMSSTSGYFSVVVGTGSTPTNYTGVGFDAMFANGTLLTGSSSCTETPAAGSARSMAISINIASAGYESYGAVSIYPTQVAAVSEKVGAHTPNSLLRVETSGVPATAPILTPALATELSALLGGTSNNYMKAGANAGVLSTNSSTTAGAIWYDSGTQTIKFYNGSAPIALSTGGGGGGGITALTGDISASGSGSVAATIGAGVITDAKIASATITAGKMAFQTLPSLGCAASQVPSYNGSSWMCKDFTSPNTPSSLIYRDASGNFSAGTGTFNTGIKVTDVATTGQITLSAPTSTSSYTITLPSVAPTNGQILVAGVSGLMSWNAAPAGDFKANGTVPMTQPLYAAPGTIAAPGVAFNSTANTGMFLNGLDLGFSTQGASRVYITSSGNVGIGTTSPAYKFDVTGVVNASQFFINGTDISNSLGAWVNGGADVYRTSGNVGIGTISPAALLNVAATSGTAKAYVDGFGAANSGYGGFIGRQARGTSGAPTATQANDVIARFGAIGKYDSTAAYATPSVYIDMSANQNFSSGIYGSKMDFYTTADGSGTPIANMSLSNNGMLGIGVTAPQAYLHLRPGNSTVPPIRFTLSGATLTGPYYPGALEMDSNDFYFTDQSSARKKLIYNGAPGTLASLDVAGNGRFLGQLTTSSTTSPGISSVTFTTNTVTTTYDCPGTITLGDLREGGHYTLVVTGTGTASCTFNGTTTGQDAGAVTYKFKPANSTRTASSHTIYRFDRVGSTVYVDWTTGY